MLKNLVTKENVKKGLIGLGTVAVVGVIAALATGKDENEEMFEDDYMNEDGNEEQEDVVEETTQKEEA